MARDVQIRLPDGAAPAAYTVPNATEIVPRVIRAVFDGTGAAGNFVPTAEIVSDGGVVVATVPCQTTVTAGDSAEVTWAPFLRAAPAAAAGALSPSWGTYFTASVLVGAGGRSSADFSFNSGSPLLDLTTPALPKFAAAGVYAVSSWVQSSDTWTADSVGAARLGFGTPTSYETRRTGTVGTDGILRNFDINITAQATAGAALNFQFENFDSAARNMYTNQLLVQLIGTYTP